MKKIIIRQIEQEWKDEFYKIENLVKWVEDDEDECPLFSEGHYEGKEEAREAMKDYCERFHEAHTKGYWNFGFYIEVIEFCNWIFKGIENRPHVTEVAPEDEKFSAMFA